MAHRVRFAFVLAASAYQAAELPGAITITPTADPDTLADALVAGDAGITVTLAELSGHEGLEGQLSSGTFTVSSPPDTYTFTGGGIVLSTGDVATVATGPNTTPCTFESFLCLTYPFGISATDDEELLLDPITGGDFDHFDVTQLAIQFDVDPGVNTLYFRLAFGSDEYPIFFETIYNDGFGLYLNDTNLAFVDAVPINISHPSTEPRAGTELNALVIDAGVPAFTIALPVTGGSKDNLLQFVIGDASDDVLDTAIYIANLGAEAPPGAIFFSPFDDPCTSGWSFDTGFVPNCEAAPEASRSAAGPREAERARALVEGGGGAHPR